MGKSLRDYAMESPMEEPPQMAEQRRAVEDAWERAQKARERVDHLKGAIAAGLEQGTAPQYLLYGAIEAISILDGDPEWGEPLKGKLDAVYEDLAQESLLVDNAAIAAARLQKMQREHNAKLRKELNRQLGKQVTIEAELRKALAALDELEEGEKPFLG